jgi:hypothetical protein
MAKTTRDDPALPMCAEQAWKILEHRHVIHGRRKEEINIDTSIQIQTKKSNRWALNKARLKATSLPLTSESSS